MSRLAVLSMLAILLTGVIGAPIGAVAHPSISSGILASPPASAVASSVVIGASARPSYPSVGFGVVALLIAGMTVSALYAAGRRRRRLSLRVMGLSLLLVMTSFEGAIHSVHHLGDPAAAEHCLVAAAGMHVAVVDVADPCITDPLLQANDAPPQARPSVARTLWLAPDAGRGPPA
jgi:hypothetical protein